MDDFLKSGRYLYAIPMIAFGVDHFVYANFVATIVPPWMPWPLFWTYLVGVALLTAGICILLNKYSSLASTLLGGMIMLFVLLIHVRLLAHRPDDVYAAQVIFGSTQSRWINCFKDMALSSGAFMIAGSESKTWNPINSSKVLRDGRLIFALCMIAFGILHFLYPAYAPGLPPTDSAIVLIIPGHALWVFLTGATFLSAGSCILVHYQTHRMAALLGALILLFILLTWGPLLAAHPAMIASADWMKDIGIAGGALILAKAPPEKMSIEDADMQL